MESIHWRYWSVHMINYIISAYYQSYSNFFGKKNFRCKKQSLWKIVTSQTLLMPSILLTKMFTFCWFFSPKILNAPSNIFFVIMDGKDMYWFPFECKIKLIILWTEFLIAYFDNLVRVRMSSNWLLNVYKIRKIWFWLLVDFFVDAHSNNTRMFLIFRGVLLYINGNVWALSPFSWKMSKNFSFSFFDVSNIHIFIIES